MVAEFKQEAHLLSCDPEGDTGWTFPEEWRCLVAERKWKKSTIFTVMFYCIAKIRQIPYGLLEESFDEAPNRIQNDEDIILARLAFTDYSCRRSKALPLRSPQIFWENKSVVVIAVNLSPKVLYQQKSIPARFLDDEDVFLAFTESKEFFYYFDLSEISMVVSLFSNRIRYNPTLMLSLVNRCGLCLRFIDESIDRYIEIVRAACQQNFKAWQYCSPGREKVALLNSKAFILKQFNQMDSFYHRSVGLKLYDALPERLKSDIDIMLLVLRHGLTLDDIPSDFTPRGRQFWLNACGHLDCSLWTKLPLIFKNDPQFLTAFRFVDSPTVELVLRTSPHFAQNRQFWSAVIQSDWNIRHLFELLLSASPAIRQDRNLMTLACGKDIFVYEHLDAALQEDHGIVAATIEAGQFAFFEFPPSIHFMYPELTATAIRNVKDDEVEMRDINQAVWSNLEVMKALADHYMGDYYMDAPDQQFSRRFPDEIRNNEDFCLYMTRYCAQVSDFEAFSSEALRSNQEFMKRAVALNPVCHFAGVGELSRNFDVAVVAFSQGIYNEYQLFGENESEDQFESALEFLHSVATQAREKIVTFEGFTRCFLYGFIDRDCDLAMLHLDRVTSAKLKSTIAAFAGVPLAEDLGRLRAVSLNMLYM